MYGQIASVRGAVDLSPQESLDQTQSFLTQQGYTIARRSDYALIAERPPLDTDVGHPLDTDVEQNKRYLMITALPLPHGGVHLRVRGNDRERVQEQQAAWTEWSEGLPKKAEVHPDESRAQRTLEISDIPLPTPPVIETLPFCPICGHHAAVGGNFCQACGTDLRVSGISQGPPNTQHRANTPTTSALLDDSAKAWIVRGMGIALGGVLFFVSVFIVIPILLLLILFLGGIDLINTLSQLVR
jgi:hypothetical protein